tara:strand:+ start:1225 stop:1413 length:189 start_codon:yes stop_codon:yes gene_type:complete
MYIICELLSNIYNYFYYSILKNNDDNMSERLLNENIENNSTRTLSIKIDKFKKRNELYNFYE